MASAGHTAKRGRPPTGVSEPLGARPTQRSRCDSSTSSSGSAAGSLQPPPALVIWDLDETLILFNSLITGSPPFIPATADTTVAAETLKQRGAAVGERMESLIWSLLDDIFDFQQLEKSEYASVTEAFVAGESADSGQAATSEQSWLVGEGEAGTPLRRRSMSTSTHSQTPAQV